PATTSIYTPSLHDALPISLQESLKVFSNLWYLPILLMILVSAVNLIGAGEDSQKALRCALFTTVLLIATVFLSTVFQHLFKPAVDRKSTRLNSSHVKISYA